MSQFEIDHHAYGINAGSLAADGRDQGNFFTPSYAIEPESAGVVQSESISTTIPDPLNADPLNSLANKEPNQADPSTFETTDTLLKFDLSTTGNADPPAQADPSTTGNAGASSQDHPASIASTDPPDQNELWRAAHAEHMSSRDQPMAVTGSSLEQRDLRPPTTSKV